MARMTVLALALALATGQPVPAQTPADLPDTPAAAVFREWLRAVNSGDTAVIRAYAVRYEAEQPHDPESVGRTVQMILRVARQSGGVRVVAVGASAPERLELMVEDARGTRLAMFLEVARIGADWRIVDIGLRPAGAPAEERAPPLPSGLPDRALADSVAARADAAAARGTFEGVVLIAPLEGAPLLRRAWGRADRRTGARNSPDTRFALASLGKMFTAVSIAQLVEAGRIALDSPLARYLPDYPDPDFARRATVRHLLSHTSGLGSYWGPEFERRRAALLTPADHLPLFVGAPRPFEPGARFRYSNAGYQVLGLLIERVSGVSYYAYVERNVFARAGMHRTGYYPPTGSRPEGAAIGYPGPDARALDDNEAMREIRGGPAGGGYSTADDLLRFAQALVEGRLVGHRTLAELTRPHSDGGSYGLGFMTIGTGRARAFGHSGGSPGMATWLLVWPEQRLVTVTLSNRDPPFVAAVQQPLMRALAAR
jgi:CubicO group peptidase (beta-lactamase class C family)